MNNRDKTGLLGDCNVCELVSFGIKLERAVIR